MADGPKAPSKQAEVKKAEVDVIVPPTEVVISMAPSHFTREQVMDIIGRVNDARAKGLSVRFA
jgi:hypothetical protein